MQKVFLILLGLLLVSNTANATRYVTTTTYPKTPAYNPSVYNHTYRTYDHSYNQDYAKPIIYDRPYDNPKYHYRYGADSSSVKTKRVGGLLNSISNMLMGSPTGFTPQVNPYAGGDFYAPNGRQTDYQGRNGWYHSNEQIGSGMGIKILD